MGKLTDFLDKVGIIKNDETTQKDNGVQSIPSVTPVFNNNTTPAFNISSSVTNSAPAAGNGSIPPEMIDKFNKHFLKLMKDSNLPGPDYFEYKEGLNNMAGVAIDEANKFKMCFASMKAMMLTKGILLTSAPQYIKILEKEKAEFDASIVEDNANEVGNRTTQIQQLEQSNQGIIKQIEDLNTQMSNNSTTMLQLKSEIDTLTGKHSVSKACFEHVYNTMVNEISSDITKINNYITE